ncbi:thioredoxin domain-containing protein 16-like isoform X2 [Amphiura filiformis]|uniref:thioredoxin domain-containing protein 16-like isoform X2 n=1 Tax=Amphiura filiformis TaxID=82378 RepID=UPI003B210C54
MANSWLPFLAILAYFGAVVNAEKAVGYNVVSGEEFKKQVFENPESRLLRVVYFWKFDTIPGGPEGHIIKSFQKNYEDAGKYVISFKIKFMTVDCTKDPVKEYCDKPKVETLVFVFKDDYVLDEMPMDILYSLDSIVANVLHLALLMEVPTVHTAMELASLKLRAIETKKNVIFGKIMAIGTPKDRAFMEGVFAYSFMYQFAMTTSRMDNILGIEDVTEWEEEDDRVWYFDCANAKNMDCDRSIYHGPMTVQNFAIFIKTLTLPTVCDDSNFAEKLPKPLHEMLGLPVSYLITTEEDLEEHRQVYEKIAKVYKGNLVFAINTTKPGETSDLCPRPPPCVSIKPPGKHPMGLSKPFNLVNMDELVRDWLEDYYFDPAELLEDDDDHSFGPETPDQEKQDDAVALAVDQMKPLKLNLTDIPHLTDKTFAEHLKKNKISIVLFTVKWDPRSLAFLHPYHQAAKTLMKDFSLEKSPLARVECSDWPDVCDKNNVTRFPTIKVFEWKKFVRDYTGSLDTDSVVSFYKLFKLKTPVMLSDALDVEYFKLGQKPVDNLGDLVQSVTVAVIPEVMATEIEQYKLVAKELRGEYVLGLCTGHCAEDTQVTANAYLFVERFNDPHKEETHFKGDLFYPEIRAFIERASLPTVPELTPASLPKLLWYNTPFVILFRVPGDEASQNIEEMLVKLTEFENRVVMAWMDASPDSVGSRLLHGYNFKDTSPPNLVFLHHATSRVCNYPNIVDIAWDKNELFSQVIQWMIDLLQNEGSCNVLESGHHEPQVPSYDFLSRIKANRQRKDEQADQARGRFGPQKTVEIPDEGDEVEGDAGEEKKPMEKYEDEMFGMEKDDDMKNQMQAEKPTHTEL